MAIKQRRMVIKSVVKISLGHLTMKHRAVIIKQRRLRFRHAQTLVVSVVMNHVG
jgi:hypothetical protein